MIALASAEWQGQEGSAGIEAMVVATIRLAVSAFCFRLLMTISTVT